MKKTLSAPAPGERRVPPLAAFRSRDFTLLWFGVMVSQMGTQMQIVAVTWQVYELTRDPLALGGIGAARLVPLVLLALGSGVLADAVDRRRLLIFAQAAMMCCSLGLALASSFGGASIWLIYALVAMASAASTLAMPARQAIVPSLVPREHLPQALSLNIIGWQTATILGPTIGGLVLAAYGVATVYWLDASSFVVVITALLLMRPRPPSAERRPLISMRAALEGLGFVRRQPLIWSTMLLDFMATFFGSSMLMLPLFANEVLFVGERELGLLYAAPAAGAVIASTLLSLRGLGGRQGPTLIVAVIVYGLCIAAFGLSQTFWFSLLMLAGAGAADTVSMVVRGTIRQIVTPDELRGRMVSVNMIFFAGGPQLGEVEAGIAARLLGGPLSVAFGGLACVASAALIAVMTPQLRRYDSYPEEEAPGKEP